MSQYTQMYQLPPPDTLNQIVDLAMDSQGRIWAGIYVGYLGVGGVAMWDGNEWIDYDETDGLVGSNIRGIEIDSFDDVWVVTGTGVSKIGNTTYRIDNVEKSEVSVYPNPCYGDIQLALGGNYETSTISVFDQQGRLLQHHHFFNSSKINYRIEGEPGTYFIQFMKGESLINTEVVPVIKL